MFGAPLLVLIVGVLASRCIAHPNSETSFRPIIEESQQQRICADLCRAGLGGEPCGAVCFDLLPTGIPFQLPNITEKVHSKQGPRRDACPVLCQNRLGFPLCKCYTIQSSQQNGNFHVDFNQICDHYCIEEKLKLRGCPCSNQEAKKNGPLPAYLQNDDKGKISNYAAGNKEVDWGKWCNQQCAQANGGSACNCDILPFLI